MTESEQVITEAKHHQNLISHLASRSFSMLEASSSHSKYESSRSFIKIRKQFD